MLGPVERWTPSTEISVHYQPIVDLRTGRTAAVEALLRGCIDGVPRSPRPLLGRLRAEGVDVPALVLDAVARDVAAWDAAGASAVSVSVNADASDVERPGLGVAVDRCIAIIGAERLLVEVTEIEAVDGARAAHVLDHLRASGVRLALDDFGTAESTLQQFERVRPDVIKIDRRFVAGLRLPAEASSGDGRAMVEVTLALARPARLRVVAEGVETVAQLAMLRRLGCTHAQGYLFGPAMSAERIGALLAGQGPTATCTAAAPGSRPAPVVDAPAVVV